jgi:hypothetical protein
VLIGIGRHRNDAKYRILVGQGGAFGHVGEALILKGAAQAIMGRAVAALSATIVQCQVDNQVPFEAEMFA